MTPLQRLKSAQTLHDVAELLDFKPKMLAYVLYKKPVETKYSCFAIPKRSGGLREISKPCEELMLLQRNLCSILMDCNEELKKVNKWNNKLSHAFERDRSIVSNAERHRKRKLVLNLDLQDFFGSINFGRVRGYFIKNKDFALSPAVATILAQIACYNNALPQGSPCSPVISNLVGHILDIRLVRLAYQNGCTYSRYADDITFSTNEKSFPMDIAVPGPAVDQWQLGSKLQTKIKQCGFDINFAKTRLQYRESRQEVTGLVVNRKVNIRREYRHRVRAMAHRLFVTGKYESSALLPGTLPRLHGMIGHIDYVDRYNAERRKTNPGNQHVESKGLVSKEILYRRFLIYKEFYQAVQPTILCEGKTDNLYLRQAIKCLAATHPALIDTNPKGESKLKVRIFKYPNTSTGRVLRLEGGTGQLKNFISHYANELKRFKAAGMTHPVLLLIDNDSGAGEIYNVVKSITKKTVDKFAAYTEVVGNLYLVATPLKEDGGPSAIEDCFDAHTKGMTADGKTFSAQKDMNTDMHYGKAAFAKLVEKNANKISFVGFAPVLSRLEAAIAAHYAKVAAKPPSQGATAEASKP